MKLYEEALKLADVLDNTKVNGYKVSGMVAASKMIRKLVAELDKQGEPVAWVSSKEFDMLQGLGDINVFKMNIATYEYCHNAMPLYTAPQTKQLSDEEILEIRWKISIDCKNDRDMWVLFARAIEERILAK